MNTSHPRGLIVEIINAKVASRYRDYGARKNLISSLLHILAWLASLISLVFDNKFISSQTKTNYL